MIDDELGKELHDRATRGQFLSAEEREQLQTWYEGKDLAGDGETSLATAYSEMTDLEDEAANRLVDIAETMERIHKLARENEELRRANAALEQRLKDQD
ncbi:MAG TPA: hypothetical protein VFD58_20630 [Blastocatellia bacterium]|nr:hypothetical protein [Blastocatellia bacterium]